jgi:hypothetical protein
MGTGVAGDVNAADVRRWARAAGLDVADRGRLSPRLVNDYLKARNGGAARSAAVDAPVPASSRVADRQSRADGGAVRTVHAKPRWDWNRPGR